MAGGQVWIPVNASMKGFATTVAKEATRAAGAGGRELEAGFKKSGAAAGQAAADGLAAQAGKVDAASRALATARKAETQAASDTIVAEERLRQLRESGTATAAELVKAETAVETAKAKAADAADRVAARESDLEKVREGGETTAKQIFRAEDQLSAARIKQAEAAGKEKAAELDLKDAQANSAAAAERVESATAALADARSRYGEDSREAVDAEKELTAAKKDADKAALDVAKAEGQARKATTELANANDDAKSKTLLLEGVQRDLADAEKQAAAEADGAADSVSRLGDEMEEAADKGGGFGGRIMDGLKKVGHGALLGVGAKIGTSVMSGVGTAFESGFGRLQSIEQAESMLGGLGHSAEGIATIMDNAMDSVSGTAYGFGEAASMAATFAGAGIEQGEELTRILGLVGDSAAITGADFQEMGSIWTKMASSGRLSTDEMNQMMDRGLGLLPELQKHYNVTADEARKMVSEGKVGFEDFAEIMEGMVGGSAQAMGDTFGGSAANMRAALGRLGAKFLEPVFANAPAIFQAVGGAVDTLGEKLGPVIAEWSERLQPVFENFAQNLGPALEGAIEGAANVIGDLVDKGQAMIAWGQENIDWIMPLVASLGVLVAAYQALKFQQTVMAAGGFIKWLGQLNAVQKVTTGITRAQAAAQAALNLVMNANPIFLVVTAVAALAAGLVLFFTKTETGREMWAKFTDLLATGWDWVSEKFSAGIEWIKEAWASFTDVLQAGWENWIKPVFDGFVTAGKFLFAVLATAVIAPLKIAWNLLSDAIAWAWENKIQPAWELMKAAASFMWNNVLMPVFNGIKAGWDLLAAGIQWAWENIVLKVWSALQTAANFMWTNVLMPVFGFIRQGWNLLAAGIQWYWENVIMRVWGALQTAANFMWTNVLMPVFNRIQNLWTEISNRIKWAYDTIIKPAWDALGNALSWLYNSIIQPTLQWIRDRWDDMSNALHAGWVFIRDSVFNALERGLEVVQKAFELAKDGIAKAWDGIRAAAAKPVKFVIQRVFNDGIVESWNKVADWVGLDPVQKYEPAWLGEFKDGGVLPGYTPGKDVHRFYSATGGALDLSGGESIMRPEWTKAVGGPRAVEAMNAAARQGGVPGVSRMLGEGAQFKDGGVLDERVLRAMSQLRGEHGKPYQWGGVGNPSWDCSGLWSGALHALNGGNIRDGRLFNTTSLMANPQAFGFEPGLSGRVTVGVSSDHMAGTIDGINIESASDPKGVQIGGSAWGSDNGYFTNTYTLTELLGKFVSGGNGGGGGVSMRSMLAGIINGILSPIGNAIPEFGGLIGGIPKAAFNKMKDAIVDFIGGRADSVGAYHGDVGAGVEQWRPLVEQILSAKGFDKSLADTVLRRMDQESSGNPSAINNWDVNAQQGWPTKGLMQMRDDTFLTHADPGFTNIWDPESNIRSSMNYAVSRYGSLPAAYNIAGGYHDGGLAPAGRGLLRKTALEPEFVLNPKMTEAFIAWMQGTPQGESAAVVAKELAEAFRGGDWGYGELASYIGEDLAKATVDVVAAIGRADRGFRDWAKATEDQDRMGTPEEWATHFGQQAAYALADEGLGLFGLDGMINKPLKQSLVDLVNAAVPHANDALKPHRSNMSKVGLGGFYFGNLSTNALQPVALLDDEGRRTGTKLAADTGVAAATPKVVAEEPEVDEPEAGDLPDGPDGLDPDDTPPVASTAPTVATDAPKIDTSETSTASTAGGGTVVIELEGGKVYAAEDLEKVNGKVDKVEFRVKKLEDDQTAGVTSGVSLLV